MSAKMEIEVSIEVIATRIHTIRGIRVMLDYDLAALYEVETKKLKQSVRRNIERFPNDFMFELNASEFRNLRSQNVTSSWGGTRYPPMAFTEQGVAMLSSVLRSKRAIQVNIQIMRTFSKLRAMLAVNEDLKRRIDELEQNTDENFRIVFEAIRQLITKETTPQRKIGFELKEDELTFAGTEGRSVTSSED